MAPPPADDPLVGQTVGGYLVEEPLGHGGMGLVYRVRHPVLNRHFAIKVLRPELADDAVSSSNFVREAQTLSSLKHPSIIDIIDFGPMHDGRQYMVMEFLLGRTLERELADDGPLDPERAIKLSDEILDALAAAHSVDVIHRDLKPSNVFLEKVSGGREVVKLLDFGLSKRQPTALRAGDVVVDGASLIAGTPAYISPEQATGKGACKQSDLYSFGVMLFEMLTGSTPFVTNEALDQSKQVLELMTRQVNEPPPTLHDRAAGVRFPEGLAEIVADLLKKKPDQRPTSAETVRKRLGKIARGLQQEATQHRPNPLLAGAPEPTPAPKRRMRAWLLGALGVTGLLVVGGWSWRQAANAVVSIPAGVPEPQPVPARVVVVPDEVKPPQLEPVQLDELDELDELARLVPLRTKKPKPVPLAAPGCAPGPDWKKRARADLNELATRAATARPELTLWVADREGPLSAAIEGATTEQQCRAVGLQLLVLKEKVKAQ